jgi:hypothetical protein
MVSLNFQQTSQYASFYKTTIKFNSQHYCLVLIATDSYGLLVLPLYSSSLVKPPRVRRGDNSSFTIKKPLRFNMFRSSEISTTNYVAIVGVHTPLFCRCRGRTPPRIPLAISVSAAAALPEISIPKPPRPCPTPRSPRPLAQPWRRDRRLCSLLHPAQQRRPSGPRLADQVGNPPARRLPDSGRRWRRWGPRARRPLPHPLPSPAIPALVPASPPSEAWRSSSPPSPPPSPTSPSHRPPPPSLTRPRSCACAPPTAALLASRSAPPWAKPPKPSRQACPRRR